MVIEIAIVFVLQLAVYSLLFDGTNTGNVIVAYGVALVLGVSSGNLFYELNKKKGLV